MAASTSCSGNAACARCAAHRLPINGELSAELAQRYAVTFDPIVPPSAGGHDGLGNLRLVHFACNLAIGDGNCSKRVHSVPRVLRR